MGMGMAAKPAVMTLVVGLSLACGFVRIANASGEPSKSGAAQTQERETVRGRFAIVRGDPPPDSGQPSRVSYILTDTEKRRWTLVFDESVYSPPGGIASFNGKNVEVQGKRTGPTRMLVESITETAP